MMSEVTVLMSCYNASRYLSEAIESVLAQTFTDFEFVLVNDGSTDATPDIIRKYAAGDQRFRIISKENTGLADSLNVGIRAARGPWIARLDADDIALPERLARQVSFLQRHDTISLLGTGCRLIDGSVVQTRWYRYPHRHRDFVRHLELGRSAFPHSSVLFHKDTALAMGGYNQRFLRAQDLDLWFRISESASVACLRAPLVHIRKHPSNISNAGQGRMSWVFSMAARVCHFIRLGGASDPSQAHDEAAWKEFIDWLRRRMEAESYFEIRHWWQHIRGESKECVALQGGRRRVLGLTSKSLTLTHLLGYIRHGSFSSTLASRLASEWLEVRADCFVTASTRAPMKRLHLS